VTASFAAAGTGALTATSGAACTPTLPAGVVAGDLLICHAFYGGSTTAPSTPTDWTLLDGPRDLDTPATNGRVWVYGKIAVGGDANPALGTQAVTTPRRGLAYRFTGVLDDTVSNVVGGFSFGIGTTTPLADAGVTTGADSSNYLAVQLIAGADDTLAPGAMTGETGGDWAIPGGFTAFTGTLGTPDTWMGVQTATVAPSTTINGGTAATTANDPWGVVGFYIRSAPPKDTAASIAETPAKSTWTGTGTSKSTSTGGNGSGTVSWQTGDTVYVFGATAQASSTTLGTPTHSGANLPAFSAVGAAVGSGSQCWAHTWSATATGSGSSVISETATSTADPWGIIAWVIRGSDGVGTRATLVSAAKDVSLTRSDAHSLVLEIIADYAAGSATLTWTPSGQTEREATQAAGLYTVGVADWGDQGSAGATSYGVSAGFDATGPLTKIALEILGTIGGGGTATPGVIAVTASLPAATLSGGGTGTPAVIAAPVTMPAATPHAGGDATPAAVSAPLTLPAATLSGGGTATPATTVLTLTLPAASASEGGTNGTATPAVINIPITLPAVTTGAGGDATPAVITTTVTLPAATLGAGSAASPGVIPLATSLPAATTGAGSTASPAVIPVTITLPAAAASGSGSGTAAPAVIVCTALLPAPTLSGGGTATPATIPLVVTIPAAAAGTPATVTPAVIPITVTTPAATLHAGGDATPATIALVTAVPNPGISAGTTVSPATIALAITLAAVIAQGQPPDPNPVTLTIRDTNHKVTVTVTGNRATVRALNTSTTAREQR